MLPLMVRVMLLLLLLSSRPVATCRAKCQGSGRRGFEQQWQWWGGRGNSKVCFTTPGARNDQLCGRLEHCRVCSRSVGRLRVLQRIVRPKLSGSIGIRSSNWSCMINVMHQQTAAAAQSW